MEEDQLPPFLLTRFYNYHNYPNFRLHYRSSLPSEAPGYLPATLCFDVAEKIALDGSSSPYIAVGLYWEDGTIEGRKEMFEPAHLKTCDFLEDEAHVWQIRIRIASQHRDTANNRKFQQAENAIAFEYIKQKNIKCFELVFSTDHIYAWTLLLQPTKVVHMEPAGNLEQFVRNESETKIFQFNSKDVTSEFDLCLFMKKYKVVIVHQLLMFEPDSIHLIKKRMSGMVMDMTLQLKVTARLKRPIFEEVQLRFLLRSLEIPTPKYQNNILAIYVGPYTVDANGDYRFPKPIDPKPKCDQIPHSIKFLQVAGSKPLVEPATDRIEHLLFYRQPRNYFDFIQVYKECLSKISGYALPEVLPLEQYKNTILATAYSC